MTRFFARRLAMISVRKRKRNAAEQHNHMLAKTRDLRAALGMQPHPALKGRRKAGR